MAWRCPYNHYMWCVRGDPPLRVATSEGPGRAYGKRVPRPHRGHWCHTGPVHHDRVRTHVSPGRQGMIRRPPGPGGRGPRHGITAVRTVHADPPDFRPTRGTDRKGRSCGDGEPDSRRSALVPGGGREVPRPDYFESMFDQYTHRRDRVSPLKKIHSNVCLAQPFETNYR